MKTIKLDITGMNCSHCVAAVAKALTEAGAGPVQVEIGSATVSYDPARTSPQTLVDAVLDAGYSASLAAS